MRAVLLLSFLVALHQRSAVRLDLGHESRRVAASYALRPGDWTPPSGQKLDVTHAPPPGVQLDTQQVELVWSRSATALPGYSRLGQRGLALMDAPGTRLVAVALSSGYEGVFVTLLSVGTALAGALGLHRLRIAALASGHWWRIQFAGPSSR